MPARFTSYPAVYSGGQWSQQLPAYPGYAQYPQAYAWGYPQYPQYGPPAMGAPYLPYPTSPRPPRREGRRREYRRFSDHDDPIDNRSSGSLTPPPEIQLHYLLGGLYRPTALWDVTQDLSAARHVPGRGALEKIPEAILAEPATEPPVHHMRIVSDSFEWVIVISLPRNEVVTVKHVFGAIHGTLEEPLERDEWDEVSTNVKRATHRARGLRLARSPASFKVDPHIIKGDLIGEKSYFMGLKPVGPVEEPKEWLLKLGLPPKSHGRR